MRLPFIWLCVPVFALCLLPATVRANPGEPLRLDMGATFSRIEQQAKVEVGAARGERLVEETEVGADVTATYRVSDYLELGIYSQLDLGVRRSGQFDGFDAEGKTELINRSGGSYTEWWTGPLVRGRYRGFFLELGYGLFAYRWDDARTDLPAEDGDTASSFRTMRTVSWRTAIGGQIEIAENLDLVARLVWRIRYYDRRANAELANDMVHGTQSYQPFLGLAWTPF